jgi:hypothetical protein
MLTVETIGRIRREHFLKGKRIKEIVRDLKVSRNTVRKILRSGETAFTYGRKVQPRPKLGPWLSVLDELLASNAAKQAREQLMLIRLFEELRGRGYDGGYDAVRRYARRWGKIHGATTATAYVPLSFAPGEAYLSFPKIQSGEDSRGEAESAHHPTRCLRSSTCLRPS